MKRPNRILSFLRRIPRLLLTYIGGPLERAPPIYLINIDHLFIQTSSSEFSIHSSSVDPRSHSTTHHLVGYEPGHGCSQESRLERLDR
jgi:hypothetical protein